MTTASPFKPPLPNSSHTTLRWTGLHGSALSLAIVHAALKHNGPVVVVTHDVHRSDVLTSEFEFYRPDTQDLELLRLPDWECLPYDHFSPHPDIISERLGVLSRLVELKQGILTLSLANLMQRLPPLDYVLGHSFSLKCGERVNINTLRHRLLQAAYQAVSQVMAPGEFAIRGGLLDIFPMGAQQPFRLDLFDDEIESIRYFDTESQRSTDSTDAIHMLPAREFPMTDAGIKQFRQAFRRQFEGDPQRHLMYREVSLGNTPSGIEFYFPLFFDATATLFDYLPKNTCWMIDSDYADHAASFFADAKDRFINANIDLERKALPPDLLYLKQQALEQHLSSCQQIKLTDSENKQAVRFETHAPPELLAESGNDNAYQALFRYLENKQNRVLLVAETAGRREMLDGLLLDNNLLPTPFESWQGFIQQSDVDFGITIAQIERPLALSDPAVSVITESQIYGERVQQRRRRSEKSRDPESIIRSLAELRLGDPVVHEVHGVGRYIGLHTLGINDEETEFLTLEYQNEDKLYVPVLSLHLIGRYVGGDSERAPLHKLGSDAWSKAKLRAERKARDVAAELLEVEALRAARKGIAFDLAEKDYAAFIQGFPFEETPDQEHAIKEVLADLSSTKPMDRLVCGDVGFGKTEVALRAAFIAVHNHRQVAMLVPTTLLAQQHFQTFQDRFADMPFAVELLSRFRTRKEVSQLVEKLTTGYPDIVVGTHRLLQDDVAFKNLGLVIIDEEHRFGVKQKQQLKKLRSEVDILTLTATPIPRTLNMAMAGLRTISIIATPPRARLSIKTFVRPYSKGLIREACLREIRRGGQVYFLHNEVRTMEKISSELQQLMPEASVQFAHGQLRESELESVMRDFYHQRFNILVCSTIVESGIDIPSANTIIINRADRFGLAQLHQLRGRVGRSHHQAFAYLLVANRELLSADAVKRLDAIENLEDLGAGFALASHDLEIRGAGELLGDTQSGLVDEIGFTLYTEYLDRAIRSLRLSRDKSATPAAAPVSSHLESIDLHTSALFPADYLPDVHSRLMLYKRLASAIDKNALYELQVEVVDRFGLLPPPAKTLFKLSEIRQQAEALGVHKIDIGPRGGRVQFKSDTRIDPLSILQLVQTQPEVYALADSHTLRIKTGTDDTDERMKTVQQLLTNLHQAQHG